jgi:hypothetical protein
LRREQEENSTNKKQLTEAQNYASGLMRYVFCCCHSL